MGEHDPFEPATEEIARELSDRVVVTLPDADHFRFLEPARAGAWSEAVQRFLGA